MFYEVYHRTNNQVGRSRDNPTEDFIHCRVLRMKKRLNH
jgi:hypothetical protein